MTEEMRCPVCGALFSQTIKSTTRLNTIRGLCAHCGHSYIVMDEGPSDGLTGREYQPTGYSTDKGWI